MCKYRVYIIYVYNIYFITERHVDSRLTREFSWSNTRYAYEREYSARRRLIFNNSWYSIMEVAVVISQLFPFCFSFPHRKCARAKLYSIFSVSCVTIFNYSNGNKTWYRPLRNTSERRWKLFNLSDAKTRLSLWLKREIK